MDWQLLTALVGAMGFTGGAIAVYPDLRHPSRWAPAAVRAVVAVALAGNALLMISTIRQYGVVETFQRDFESTLLLATLIGLMGLGTRLSATLRGLDGFLLAVAALTQMAALTVLHKPGAVVTSRPWFVSHGLAFALSGAFFVAGGVAGGAYLLIHRMLRRKHPSALVGQLASLEALERFGRWMPIIGFPLFTYGILTGLCGVWHRADLGRTAWYLDMTFVFSLAAWGVYACLSYCSLYRPRFRGRRAAALATYGMGLIVIVFLFKEFLSPMHR